MNLLLIETNKGRMIDNGFRHTVFKIGRVNDKRVLDIITTCKFNEILSEESYVESFRKDPKAFIESLND